MKPSDCTMIDLLAFFSNSALLGYLALKPLSHIRENWELTWDPDEQHYESGALPIC